MIVEPGWGAKWLPPVAGRTASLVRWRRRWLQLTGGICVLELDGPELSLYGEDDSVAFRVPAARVRYSDAGADRLSLHVDGIRYPLVPFTPFAPLLADSPAARLARRYRAVVHLSRPAGVAQEAFDRLQRDRMAQKRILSLAWATLLARAGASPAPAG